jgi:hypothetical protein
MPGSVFNADPQTTTRSYAKTDPALPQLGQIQLFPPSLPSQQQDLVNGNLLRNIFGNVNYDVVGNMTNTVSVNKTETIVGNHEHTVNQDLTHTVKGKTTETKLGKHSHTNVGSRVNHFVGTVSDFYEAAAKEIYVQELLTKIKEWTRNDLVESSVKGVEMAAKGLSAEAVVYSISAHKTGLKLGGEELTLKETKVQLHASAHKLRLQASKLVCTALLVGVLELGTPFKPNALPRPTPITPFD